MVLFNTVSGWILFPLICVFTYVTGIFRAQFQPDKAAFYHHMSHLWGAWICRSTRLKVTLENEANVRAWLDEGAVVIACNHASIMDVPVLLSILPGRFAFVAKEIVFSLPLIGTFMRFAGYIPLRRGDRRHAAQALDHAAEAMQNGISPLMFPEGTRTSDGNLQRFKRGTLLLARRTGRPILPIAMVGIQDVMPKGTIFCRPGEVLVRVGPLFRLDESVDLDDEEQVLEACEMLRDAVAALLDPALPPKVRARKPSVLRPVLRSSPSLVR